MAPPAFRFSATILVLLLAFPPPCSSELSSTLALRRPPPTRSLCAELVRPMGYPCVEHKVQTEDGYVLAVQQIPHGRETMKKEQSPPIFLQHGLFQVNPMLKTVVVFPESLWRTYKSKHTKCHTHHLPIPKDVSTSCPMAIEPFELHLDSNKDPPMIELILDDLNDSERSLLDDLGRLTWGAYTWGYLIDIISCLYLYLISIMFHLNNAM